MRGDAQRVALVLLGGAASLAAICGGGGGSGHLLLASQGSIATYDVSTGKEALLIAPVGGNGVLLRDPAASPSGKRLAYVRAVSGGGTNAGSELWIAAGDGSDAHPSVQQSGIEVEHPQWLDEQRLLALVRSPAGSAIDQINAGTGERARVVADATAFSLSPDRARIAYVKSSAGPGQELFVAAADGSGSLDLLPADQPFPTISALAFAPDSASVLFAAPAPSGPAGAPNDLWSVSAAGGAATRVATLQEPVVALTFGASSALYALTPQALFEIDMRTGAARRLRSAGDRSAISWLR